MSGVTLAALAAVGIISYDEVTNEHRMPCPARFGGIFLTFGALGLLSGPAPGLAAAFAWGLVVALVVGQKHEVVKQLTRKAGAGGGGE